MSKPIKEMITANLAERYAAADNAVWVELVGVDAGIVKVRLLGACGGCPMATMTLVGFVEERLKTRVPEIHQVVNV